jgi:hypothetical protein
MLLVLTAMGGSEHLKILVGVRAQTLNNTCLIILVFHAFDILVDAARLRKMSALPSQSNIVYPKNHLHCLRCQLNSAGADEQRLEHILL